MNAAHGSARRALTKPLAWLFGGALAVSTAVIVPATAQTDTSASTPATTTTNTSDTTSTSLADSAAPVVPSKNLGEPVGPDDNAETPEVDRGAEVPAPKPVKVSIANAVGNAKGVGTLGLKRVKDADSGEESYTFKLTYVVRVQNDGNGATAPASLKLNTTLPDGFVIENVTFSNQSLYSESLATNKLQASNKFEGDAKDQLVFTAPGMTTHYEYVVTGKVNSADAKEAETKDKQCEQDGTGALTKIELGDGDTPQTELSAPSACSVVKIPTLLVESKVNGKAAATEAEPATGKTGEYINMLLTITNQGEDKLTGISLKETTVKSQYTDTISPAVSEQLAGRVIELDGGKSTDVRIGVPVRSGTYSGLITATGTDSKGTSVASAPVSYNFSGTYVAPPSTPKTTTSSSSSPSTPPSATPSPTTTTTSELFPGQNQLMSLLGGAGGLGALTGAGNGLRGTNVTRSTTTSTTTSSTSTEPTSE
ncbi:hypothetical protein KIP68_09905, partial [Corynebacterium aquatimens]